MNITYVKIKQLRKERDKAAKLPALQCDKFYCWTVVTKEDTDLPNAYWNNYEPRTYIGPTLRDARAFFEHHFPAGAILIRVFDEKGHGVQIWESTFAKAMSEGGQLSLF